MQQITIFLDETWIHSETLNKFVWFSVWKSFQRPVPNTNKNWLFCLASFISSILQKVWDLFPTNFLRKSYRKNKRKLSLWSFSFYDSRFNSLSTFESSDIARVSIHFHIKVENESKYRGKSNDDDGNKLSIFSLSLDHHQHKQKDLKILYKSSSPPSKVGNRQCSDDCAGFRFSFSSHDFWEHWTTTWKRSVPFSILQLTYL